MELCLGWYLISSLIVFKRTPKTLKLPCKSLILVLSCRLRLKLSLDSRFCKFYCFGKFSLVCSQLTPNMSVAVQYNNTLLIQGTVATFSCKDKDQELIGRSQLICLPTGHWSSNILPECQKGNWYSADKKP